MARGVSAGMWHQAIRLSRCFSKRGTPSLSPQAAATTAAPYAALIPSPAYIVIKTAEEFKDKTTAPNQLWQTDFSVPQQAA